MPKINKIRRVITDYAKTKGICTQCLRAYVKEGCVQCARCIKLNRDKYRRRREQRAKMEKKAKQREWVRNHKRKKLVEKVTKLDKIRRAVAKGEPLPVSTTFHVKK